MPSIIDCIYGKMKPEDYSINSRAKVNNVEIVCLVARMIVSYTVIDYKIRKS